MPWSVLISEALLCSSQQVSVSCAIICTNLSQKHYYLGVKFVDGERGKCVDRDHSDIMVMVNWALKNMLSLSMGKVCWPWSLWRNGHGQLGIKKQSPVPCWLWKWKQTLAVCTLSGMRRRRAVNGSLLTTPQTSPSAATSRPTSARRSLPRSLPPSLERSATIPPTPPSLHADYFPFVTDSWKSCLCERVSNFKTCASLVSNRRVTRTYLGGQLSWVAWHDRHSGMVSNT